MSPQRFSRARTWLMGGAAVAGIAAVIVLFSFTELDWADVTEALLRVDLAALWALMLLLPVGGFSVSVVWLVAGARFGPGWGGVVVAVVTAGHLLIMHAIGRHWLRRRLRAWLQRRGHKLPAVPAGENVSVSVMAVLVPGLPYFARNYLLALSDVPLRVYFWVCVPLYVVRSYVTLFLGDLAREPSGKQLVILGVVYAVKLGVCAYLIWHIRRRIKRNAAAAG